MSPMTHLRANSLCEAPDSDDHVQLGHTWALGRVLEGLLSGLCVGVSAGLSLAGLGASGSEFGDLGVGSFARKVPQEPHAAHWTMTRVPGSS